MRKSLFPSAASNREQQSTAKPNNRVQPSVGLVATASMWVCPVALNRFLDLPQCLHLKAEMVTVPTTSSGGPEGSASLVDVRYQNAAPPEAALHQHWLCLVHSLEDSWQGNSDGKLPGAHVDGPEESFIYCLLFCRHTHTHIPVILHAKRII